MTELDHLLVKLSPGEQAELLRLLKRFGNGNENDELLVVISCLLFFQRLFTQLPAEAVAQREALESVLASFTAQFDMRLKEMKAVNQRYTQFTEALYAEIKRYELEVDRQIRDCKNMAAFFYSDEVTKVVADKVLNNLKPALEGTLHAAAAKVQHAGEALVKERSDLIKRFLDEDAKRAAFLKAVDQRLEKASRWRVSEILLYLLLAGLAYGVGYLSN